jgi:neutral ceramidase
MHETTQNNSGGPNYLVGTGIHDITGPAAEVGMMGYSMPYQKTEGIQMRLRSRAFVVASKDRSKCVAVVSADLGQLFHAVKHEVVKKLQADTNLRDENDNPLFHDANVMLSATHTHSGPGGYSNYALYNLSVLGFDEDNFNCIVEGIYNSIVKGYGNLLPGKIFIKKGDLFDAAKNRSPLAYSQNPDDEKALYDSDINTEMTLLKFVTVVDDVESAIGALNWFAVHNTNIGNTNRLISGDNKGYASYLFEKDMGTDYTAGNTFVAAFAQAESGDVTPNIWGYPDGINDFNRMKIVGHRQYDCAKSLFVNADEQLTAALDYRHMYVDFNDLAIDPEWVDGAVGIRTCPPALGFSKIAGSTEDGVGVEFIPEGMTFDSVALPPITIVPDLQECHKEKRILIPVGDEAPFFMTQEKLPVQIVTLGKLALLAVPTEFTTMAGRRLKTSVKDELAAIGIEHIVIAGYANAYTGYVTTREEYKAQHYEGASTHFGPYTLNAYQQEFNRLAVSLKEGTPIDPGPSPPDLLDKQVIKLPGVVFDAHPPFGNFGDVESDVQTAYQRGDTVSVTFWGAHPRNDLRIQGSYLRVERKEGSEWLTVAHDWDPETTYHWERILLVLSKITVEWTIPEDTEPGEYRIHHSGHWKPGIDEPVNSYEGTSREFTVSA